MKLRKFAALGLALLAPLGLSGCLILPGEFTSEMTVMKSGEFTFAYKGQIQLLGLASLLNNSVDALNPEPGEFTAVCYEDFDDTGDAAKEAETSKIDDKDKSKEDKAKDKKLAQEKADNDAALSTIKLETPGGAAATRAQEDPVLAAEDAAADPAKSDKDKDESKSEETPADTSAEEVIAEATEDYGLTERTCTEEEIATQKSEWDETQKKAKDTEAQMKKMFATMLGGIDPKDPKTIDRFTREVERLAAWNKVEHLGNGLFMIDYSTKGRLADDYAFPVIPRYALGEPMVHITRWDNGRVRVEAPSFHSDSDFTTLAMMGGGAAAAMAGGKTPDVQPIAVSGTFTLLTDARILANNTEEGPSDADAKGMQKLVWDIGPATFGPPMALLKLVQ
jgi:hypothetical protein